MPSRINDDAALQETSSRSTPLFVFDSKSILQTWQNKIGAHKNFTSIALKEVAPLILQKIASYIYHDAEVNAEPLVQKVDFHTYTLEEALLEARILRTEVLRHLPGDQNYSNRDQVVVFFDSLIASLAGQAAQFKISFQGNKDSRLLRDVTEQKEIADTVIADLEASLIDRESVLNERARFLATASKIFSTSIDYQETIAKVALLSTQDLADWCIIDCLNENDEFKRVSVRHRNPALAGLAEELRRDFQPHPKSMGVPSQVLRNKKTLLIPHVTDSHYAATARSPRHEEILRGLGSRSYMCVPLVARGHFVGAVTLVTNRKTYSDEDVVFAEEFCSLAAFAIDNTIQFLRAQAAITMRDDFVGIVCHDLKSPLHVIEMSANLLLRDKGGQNPALMKKLACTIRDSGRRMNRLIGDLLDLSRFEAGRFTIESKEEDFAKLLQEIEQSFQPIASAKGVSLTIEPAAASTLFCDHNRLIQAISNLVSNAIKFTPTGGTVYIKSALSDESISIMVEDTGCGLSSESITHIFDRFWQAHASDTRRGTGIGLSIVKMMIEAHGGTVRAESEIGKGSRFILELPRHPTQGIPVF